jgi:hypothetical protein
VSTSSKSAPEFTVEESTRHFHRMRQPKIDEELFEVVSGYEALSQGRGRLLNIALRHRSFDRMSLSTQ